jgi:hypothetical protein
MEYATSPAGTVESFPELALVVFEAFFSSRPETPPQKSGAVRLLLRAEEWK